MSSRFGYDACAFLTEESLARLSFLMLVVMLAACGTSETRFPKQAARSYCAAYKACDEDAYFDRYELGTETCRAEIAQQVTNEQYGTENTVCSWVPSLALDCLDKIDEARCGEILSDRWFAECIEAWDCVILVDPT